MRVANLCIDGLIEPRTRLTAYHAYATWMIYLANHSDSGELHRNLRTPAETLQHIRCQIWNKLVVIFWPSSFFENYQSMTYFCILVCVGNSYLGLSIFFFFCYSTSNGHEKKIKSPVRYPGQAVLPVHYLATVRDRCEDRWLTYCLSSAM